MGDVANDVRTLLDGFFQRVHGTIGEGGIHLDRIRPDEFPQLIMTWSRRTYRRFARVANMRVHHQHAVFTGPQADPVVLEHELCVTIPDIKKAVARRLPE